MKGREEDHPERITDDDEEPLDESDLMDHLNPAKNSESRVKPEEFTQLHKIGNILVTFSNEEFKGEERVPINSKARKLVCHKEMLKWLDPAIKDHLNRAKNTESKVKEDEFELLDTTIE